MSRKPSKTPSYSSSVYSQDSERGHQNTGSILGGPIRTSSPGPYGSGVPSASSRYSGNSTIGSGSGAPPRPPPSSGYSAARPPSRSSIASVGGSDNRPASPAHASIMSTYGHSSYGGSNRSSNASGSAPSGNKGPKPSGTSHVQTYADAGTQTSPTHRTPPSGPFSGGGGGQPSRPPPSAERVAAYGGSVTADMTKAETDLVDLAAQASIEKRRALHRRRRGGG